MFWLLVEGNVFFENEDEISLAEAKRVVANEKFGLQTIVKNGVRKVHFATRSWDTYSEEAIEKLTNEGFFVPPPPPPPLAKNEE